MEIINLLLEKLFMGGVEGWVSILLLIVIALGYLYKRQYDNYNKLLKQYHDLNHEYSEKLIELVEKSHEAQTLTTQSLNEIRIVLAEIKAKQ